eukprot:413513-Prymnesium_polylepis.1
MRSRGQHADASDAAAAHEGFQRYKKDIERRCARALTSIMIPDNRRAVWCAPATRPLGERARSARASSERES